MNNKKRLFIHIGAHKTGSTTIQKNIKDHDGFLSSQGYALVRSGSYINRDNEYFINNYRLSKDGESTNEYWAEAIEEIDQSPFHNLIVSAEDFYTLPKSRVEYIAGITSHLDVTIIFYKRSELGYLTSMYKQKIKVFDESRSFVEFGKAHLGQADFRATAERWGESFGPENVVVVDFDAVRTGGTKAIVNSFYTALGIEEEPPPTSSANLTPEDDLTMSLLIMNRLAASTPSPVSAWMRQIKNSMRKGRRSGRAAYLALKPITPKQLISKDEKATVAAMLERRG